MKKFFALCAYNCLISNQSSESIDIQCRYFEASTEDEVLELVRSEAPNQYFNEAGELVTWPLIEVMAVEELGQLKHGIEIVGAIRGASTISSWPSKNAT